MESKRIRWIDCAKGLLIILVIYGHTHRAVLDDLELWARLAVYSFHMSAFFILAGITFNANKDFRTFIIGKAKRILLPYLTFCLLYLLYKYLTSIICGKPHFELLYGLSSILYPVSGSTHTSVYGLWFFPCLFVSQVIFYWILKTRRIVAKIGVFALVSMLSLMAYKYNTVSAYSCSALSISGLWGGVFIEESY